MQTQKNFWVFFHYLLDNLGKCMNTVGMINANAKTDKHEYERSWISSVKFTKDEKQLIVKARKTLHVDMPILYHDCIMASVLQIVKKGACE